MSIFKRFRKAATPAPKGQEVPSTPPKGKIMIVDDDAVVRKALGMKIGESGYALYFAADGAEAVTMARNEKPDVIILDINFPAEPGLAWDGFKLLRWLHRSPEGAIVPIIIITGEESPQNRAKAMGAGAVGFFQKPVDTKALLAAIDQLVVDSGKDSCPS